MLVKDYIDQMGEKYDYFRYNIKFKKHAFIYLVFKKKRKVSNLSQAIIISSAQ